MLSRYTSATLASLFVLSSLLACAAGGTSASTRSGPGGTPTGGTTGGTQSGSGSALITYQANPNAINNPERGFFKWVDIINTSDFSFVRTAGSSLGFAVVRLDDYRNTSLPDTFLAQVGNGLANARAAHIKLVVRFAYNYPGSDPDGSATADAPLSIIQEQASQLAPILASNVDVIAVLEAGFIGEWGEWHDSTSGLGDPNDRLAVMNAVLAALPTSRYALIRYPYEKRENWQGPLTAQAAFGTTPAARIGHHNDCFLDGQDEGGTFQTAADMNYLAADTFYVPMGGETCAVSSPWSDCPNATAELATYHWAFLNADFDTDVLNNWTQQGCMGQVTNLLGYRYTLQDATMNLSTPSSSGTLNLVAHLRNDGYARMYNQSPVYIVLNAPAGRHNYPLTDVDPRMWDPNSAVTLNANVSLGAVGAGTYTVALWMPDAASNLQDIADYSVQCANAGTWDPNNGYNVLTTGFVVH